MTNQGNNNLNNQVNNVSSVNNTADQYEQLFKAYDDFQKSKKPQEGATSFWTYIQKEASWFTFDGIVNTYNKLWDRNNLEDIKKTLQEEKEKKDTIDNEKREKDTERNKQIATEKANRLVWLIDLIDAFDDFKYDPNYTNNTWANAFINFLNERKKQNNDTSITYFGFESNEIQLSDDKKKIIKPNRKSIQNEKTENEKKGTESRINEAKERLKKTIDRYIEKIKDIKDTNTEEIIRLKEELKTEKEAYKNAQKDFFTDIGKNYTDFSEEGLKKLPTRLLHYKQKEWLFNKPDGFNSISAIRRRRTINTFIKKFNKIGTEHKDGVRFVMNFHKSRFLRYSDIKVDSAIDKLGGNIGLQMNPQQFHEKFNAWKKAIKDILRNPNAGKLEDSEEKIVTAIENRINYYWAAYAKERANARVWPFIEAEKNAGKDAKIIQMNTAPKAAAA